MKKTLILTFISIFIILTTGKTCLSLEISEISLKNKENDWIEIDSRNYNSEENSTIEIRDDKIITEISAEELKNNNFILIIFKSAEEKRKSENKILKIYIKNSGLTGTTEQITIVENSKIIDAVCWQNSSPSKKEEKDIKEIKEINAWKGECINSKNIKNNNSIAKTGKLNSKESWTIFKHPSQGKENIEQNEVPIAEITIQKGKAEDTVPFSINLDGSNSNDPDNDKIKFKWIFPNNKIIEKANPASYKFEKAGNYEIKLIVEDELNAKSETILKIVAKNDNGDLSDKITINELFINPKGKDSNKEWIELYNSGEKNINLGNWKLNNGKSESKLSKNLTIPAKNYLVIEGKNLGLSLKNANGEINLLDFENKLIDQKSYKETKENMSLSLTKIKDYDKKQEKNEWLWTETSKKRKNPEFYEINGTISKKAEINKEYYFKIKTKKNEIKVIFEEKVHKFELVKELFKINTEIKILSRKINENTYFLIDYNVKNEEFKTKLKSKKLSTPKWTYIILIPIAILIIIIFYLSKD